MATGALALFVVLGIGIGSGLALFWLVRVEAQNRVVMDRVDAERTVRSDDSDKDEGTRRG